MTDCIFCKIAQGEIPSAKVYEDDVVYAFLDMSQVTPGHLLVIPKEHVKDIFEYDGDLAGEVFKRVPKIARAMEAAFPEMKGLNIMNNNREIAYQSVFHSHIHLLPRYSTEDNFSVNFEPTEYSQEDFQARAQAIADQIKD